MSKKMPPMQQRNIDFEKRENRDAEHVAIATSLPPPATATSAPLSLVRPDRQVTYDGSPHYEWPAPHHDRDTITVDRIREDIDRPSHRFIIKRGDTVEVFLSRDRTDVGEVTGISQRNEEVRVSFREGSDGLWYSKGQIYPAAEESPKPTANGRPLSEIIAEVNLRHGEGLTQADRVPPATPSCTPYTFDDFKAFYRDMAEGSITFDRYWGDFGRLVSSKEAITAELQTRFNAPQLKVLASRMGSWHARGNTKDQNAADIYRRMLLSFVLDGSVSCSMGENYEDALRRKVLTVTPEQLAEEFSKRETAAAERDKALSNPETFYEFRTFLQSKSEGDLTDEQLARYDTLHAESTRERRKADVKTSVTTFESDELSSYEFQIREGYHDRRQCPLWIVKLQTRVERSTFNELNIKAKMLGGWYSSFKKSDAGFQFTTKDQADRFASLLRGDVDRADVLEKRQERKEQTAVERLHELADVLASRADETVRQSNESLQNTARRAGIQAGVRGRAYREQALARTMHSVAEALSRGEANYLEGIRHRTHIETLDSILYLAKCARIRAVKRTDGETRFSHGRHSDGEESQPISPADIRFAEYPFPTVYMRHLEGAIAKCRTAKGARMASERMAKRIRREKEEYITFDEPHDIDELQDYLGRAKAVGYDTERMDLSLEKYRRLQRAGIHDIHELRCALREYLPHLAETRGDDPVRVAERELIGRKLPGFFPTPRPVIEEMLKLAGIENHHRVLEPSCGKGDILDALRNEYPEASLTAIEQNRALEDVLSAKGHDVEFADFLSHRGRYDRIVMNPPFEYGQDIDHVRHAFEQLAVGGRLVAVVSEGPFFRQDKKAQSFREWIQDVRGEDYALPDDAFQGADSFRQTGVKTRLLVIERLWDAR